MASKKDMRRTDLVIPYISPKEEKAADFGTTFGSTMPMAAMFTRNKMLGWLALLTSVLNWLGETAAQKTTGTPGYLGVGMSVMALGVIYMPLFLPPPATASGTGTGAAAPVPS